jgi:hypothetical protein
MCITFRVYELEQGYLVVVHKAVECWLVYDESKDLSNALCYLANDIPCRSSTIEINGFSVHEELYSWEVLNIETFSNFSLDSSINLCNRNRFNGFRKSLNYLHYIRR